MVMDHYDAEILGGLGAAIGLIVFLACALLLFLIVVQWWDGRREAKAMRARRRRIFNHEDRWAA